MRQHFSANDDIRRFDKCPGQILVAILAAILAFFLAVTFPSTIHTARVGSEVTRSNGSVDITRFESDGFVQYIANSRCGFQEIEFSYWTDLLEYGFLQY